MTTSDIIDGIIQKKNAIGMTNQQLADASGVPKTTIDRILRHDTPNPSMQSILDLAAAVGFTFSNHPDQLPPVPEEIKIGDPMIQHMINFYERQAITYEERLKRTAAVYNMMLAEKNRWIQSLSLIIGLLVVGFISLLLIDLATPDLGWFPHDANSITIGLSVIGILVLVGGAYFLHRNVKK